jgi:hypothetical protein
MSLKAQVSPAGGIRRPRVRRRQAGGASALGASRLEGPGARADRPHPGTSTAGQRRGRARRRRALLAALLIAALPVSAEAQVFIASRPNPHFRVAPLFVTATITRKDVGGGLAPMTVTVVWNVVGPPGPPPADLGDTLFLLWPGQVAGGAPGPSDDRALNAELEGLKLTVKSRGELPLKSRRRSDMGTAAPLVQVGKASYVSFTGNLRPGRRTRGGTLVRIPWGPKIASSDSLLLLELPLHDAITPTQVSWLEEAFWDRRYLVALGFGEVGDLSLYPLYFGHRDRVLRLAPDFSFIRVNFADANHLKIDEITPASVSREPSESRENTDTVTLPLLASEGMIAQALKVKFSYFPGRVAWRPILISMLFLIVGNLTGPLVHAAARRARKFLRARVQLGPTGRGLGEEQSGVVIPRQTLEQITPGETTWDDVVRLCGLHGEVHESLADAVGRSMVYRGQRRVPHQRWSVGWLAAIRAWDVEHHEVEIEFEGDRVRNVQARVRRTRLPTPDAA